MGLPGHLLPREEGGYGNLNEQEHLKAAAQVLQTGRHPPALSECLSPETATKLLDPLLGLLSGFEVQDS